MRTVLRKESAMAYNFRSIENHFRTRIQHVAMNVDGNDIASHLLDTKLSACILEFSVCVF